MWGHKLIWSQRRHQPFNHLEEEEAETFSMVLQRRKLVFGEEARNKARRSGPVVTGDEADCVSLDALQSVDVLLVIRVPDGRAVLHEWTYKGEVGVSSTG
jgi:hypothetical protein